MGSSSIVLHFIYWAKVSLPIELVYFPSHSEPGCLLSARMEVSHHAHPPVHPTGVREPNAGLWLAQVLYPLSQLSSLPFFRDRVLCSGSG